MKKIIRCLVVLIVCLLVDPVLISKAEPKTVTVEITVDNPIVIINGENQSPMGNSPFIENSRLYVPVILISEILHIKVEYDFQMKILTFSNPKINLALQYKSLTAIVNGKEVQIDVSFVIRGSRSQVPVRFICETFGATVSWDPVLHKATIVYEVPEEE